MSEWIDQEPARQVEDGARGGSKGNQPIKNPKDRKPETTEKGDGSARRNIIRKSKDQSREKKLGGGHKGHWSKVDDGTLSSLKVEHDDPNYDSTDDDGNIVYDDGQAYSAHRRLPSALIPRMSLSEFKIRIADAIKEYFISEDVQEVRRTMRELRSPVYHYELVKRAINMSFDQRDRDRELVSRLLSDLYPDVITTQDVGKGFERLFEIVDDLALDAPCAVRYVATFLARAVRDEILPPSFLSDPLVVGLGGEVVENAKLLLSRDHMGARLEHIWGPGDGRSVAELKVAIDQLVQEYLLSRQLEEAVRCVRELDVPHFHHELVKRAVVIALDKSEDDRQAVTSLLAYLCTHEVISKQQIYKGFHRLTHVLPDLLLDVPNAPALLHEMVKQAQEDGCLPPDFPIMDQHSNGYLEAKSPSSSA